MDIKKVFEDPRVVMLERDIAFRADNSYCLREEECVMKYLLIVDKYNTLPNSRARNM